MDGFKNVIQWHVIVSLGATQQHNIKPLPLSKFALAAVGSAHCVCERVISTAALPTAKASLKG